MRQMGFPQIRKTGKENEKPKGGRSGRPLTLSGEFSSEILTGGSFMRQRKDVAVCIAHDGAQLPVLRLWTWEGVLPISQAVITS